MVRSGVRPSHIWWGIVQFWLQVEQGVSWIIKNGHSVKFWQDNWVPGMGALYDHATTAIPL